MNSVSTMDRVLRSVYLDAITNNLNMHTSLFYNRIEKSSANVYGKEIIAPCRFGINGGIASVPETDNLPEAAPSEFSTLRAPLMNIYGNIEFSDKLVKISESGQGSSVDLINDELEGLLQAARFNLRRMLFQNGSGRLAYLTQEGVAGNNYVIVNETKNLAKGMIIDFVLEDDVVATGYKIVSIGYDAGNDKIVTLNKSLPSTVIVSTGLYLRGSYDNEIFGIPYLFDKTVPTFYGNTRSIMSYAQPIYKTTLMLNTETIQECMDEIEVRGHEEPNIFLCDFWFRRQYLTYIRELGLGIDYAVLEDGYKAPLFSGIPICADRFMGEKKGYFLNTNDFVLGQLGDWSWVEGNDHTILHPIPGKAAYNATLVKYCNLICTRPTAQLELSYNTDTVGE